MPIHDQSNINLLIGILENEFNRKSVVGEKFVDFFNKRLEIYHEKRFNYADLQQMNKCILSDCYQFINRENIEIEKNTMVLKPPPSNHGFQTATDNIKSKNNSAFDDYKKQYDTMLNPAKPGEIDFSDTIEDEPILNIDTIVNQTLEESGYYEETLARFKKLYGVLHKILEMRLTNLEIALSYYDAEKKSKAIN